MRFKSQSAQIFGPSAIIALLSLVAGFVYGGWSGLFLCAILGILEISLSFDNAVVNATILERMDVKWQKVFLTVGILIAVFGMRLILPLIVVMVTAGLNPVDAITLALEKRPLSDPTSYAALLDAAYPAIAGFGGVFLMMLFLDWVLEDRDIKWLLWLERPLARIGQLDRLSIVVTLALLVVFAETLAEDPATVLFSGALGLVLYLVVNALGNHFEGQMDLDGDGSVDANDVKLAHSGASELAKATGKAGLLLFLYLEMIDAAFSFDGVIGAFAITPDPILIALGLGLIGAMFVRSLTVFLVRKGTLNDYVYLEHGAHWAIGALAVILMLGVGYRVNEVVTGLIGVGFIGVAFWSSVIRNKRKARKDAQKDAQKSEISDKEEIESKTGDMYPSWEVK